MTAELFDLEPPIPGLRYRPGVIGPQEQDAVVRAIEELDLRPFRFQGWEARRLTRSFGFHLDFDRQRFERTEAMPDWLDRLRPVAADLAGIAPEDFAHALVARYDPGAGIGWHRDRPHFGWVVGLSFGAAALLRFRRRTEDGFDRLRLRVDPGSAYLLSGDARTHWEHSIAPGEQLRFSVTLRTLSDLGRSKSGPD